MKPREPEDLSSKLPREDEDHDRYPETVPSSLEVAEPVASYDYGAGPASAVLSLLAEQLTAFERAGGSFDRLGGTRAVVARMMATLPAASPWNEALGPFYTTQQVARFLGDVSRQAIASRRSNDSIVALRTADDHWVYPAFQFDTRHGLLPGLAELWVELVQSGEERWTLARWLLSAQDELDGRSVVEALRDGAPASDLRPLVRDAALRFSH